jgi:hypothetical protein
VGGETDGPLGLEGGEGDAPHSAVPVRFARFSSQFRLRRFSSPFPVFHEQLADSGRLRCRSIGQPERHPLSDAETGKRKTVYRERGRTAVQSSPTRGFIFA